MARLLTADSSEAFTYVPGVTEVPEKTSIHTSFSYPSPSSSQDPLQPTVITITGLSDSDFNLEKFRPNRTPSPTPPDSIYGWLIVLVSFAVLFIQVGITYSYGVFLHKYSLKYPQYSLTTLSFIGTLSPALSMILSIFSGRLVLSIGFRGCIWIGGFLFSLGLFLASISQELWQLFLSQGCLMGIGSSLLFIPSISAPSQWFHRQRGLATGIASMGSGLGGLLSAPLIQHFIEYRGVENTLLILSIVSFIVFCVSGLIIRNRIPPSTQIEINCHMFRDIQYCFFFIGKILFSFGLLIPIILVTVQAIHLGFSYEKAALLLGVLHCGSTCGQIIFRILAYYCGSINVLIICVFFTSLSTLLIWPFSYSLSSLFTYALFFGTASGGFLCLVPVTLVQVFGKANLANTFGLVHFGSALPILIGTPLASIMSVTMVDSKHHFTFAIFFAGGIFFLSLTCFIIFRTLVFPGFFKRI